MLKITEEALPKPTKPQIKMQPITTLSSLPPQPPIIKSDKMMKNMAFKIEPLNISDVETADDFYDDNNSVNFEVQTNTDVSDANLLTLLEFETNCSEDASEGSADGDGTGDTNEDDCSFDEITIVNAPRIESNDGDIGMKDVDDDIDDYLEEQYLEEDDELQVVGPSNAVDGALIDLHAEYIVDDDVVDHSVEDDEADHMDNNDGNCLGGNDNNDASNLSGDDDDGPIMKTPKRPIASVNGGLIQVGFKCRVCFKIFSSKLKHQIHV